MNVLEQCGVHFTEVSSELIVQKWTVKENMTQINGILHGGLSAAIAEQGAGMGAVQLIPEGYAAVGTSLESHHLKAVPMGSQCETRAMPETVGGKLQVWRVEQRILPTKELFNVSTVTIYIKKVTYDDK